MAKQPKMTKLDFLSKVNWEGGFYEAASYGLKPEEIRDKTLAKLWGEYCELQKLLEAKGDEIEAILPQDVDWDKV